LHSSSKLVKEFNVHTKFGCRNEFFLTDFTFIVSKPSSYDCNGILFEK
jgi:hypothetical protein